MSAVDSATTAAAATATSSSTASKARFGDNFDSFLLLLTTQLKSQSPLDPLDTNQFTQQLVQFAQVEQQIKANDNLESLITLSKNSQATTAASFLGADVTAKGDKAQLNEGSAKWNYTVTKPAKATVTIRNDKGTIVFSEETNLQPGGGPYSWNGRNTNGTQEVPGTYSATFVARDTSGQPVDVKTEIKGKVDSVDLSGTSPKLSIGGTFVDLNDIIGLRRSA